MFYKFQRFLEKFIGPIAERMQKSKVIQALTNGMMAVLPVSLGVAFIAIVGNFPIPIWQEFLTSIGLAPIIQEVIAMTSGLYAVYIVCTIAYETAKMEKQNPITSVILSLAFFLILVPQFAVKLGGEETIVIKTASIGTDGIFVAILVGLGVTMLYSYLMKKEFLRIKLPDSVPTMVTDSLSPTFVAMIIFVVALLVKAIFTYTGSGDAMSFLTELVSKPIASLGQSPMTVIVVFTLANLLWFFGIHPSPIINIFFAVMAPVFLANINAFIAGQALPYPEIMFFSSIIMVGGTGNTIGLAFCMLRAKSERYKSLGKLGVVPSIFNINEPLIFGVPIMLNPIFFIPLVSSTAVGGLVLHLFYKVGFLNYYNPTVELPWATPPVVAETFYGGIRFGLAMIAVVIALTLLYYPFFRMADERAVKEEQTLATGEQENE